MGEVESKVKLIDYTNNPERNIAIASRMCYSDKNFEELSNNLSEEEIEEQVKKILDLGHYSTLEHTFFMFSIKTDRVSSHQLVRQRIGVGYSQRSQRFVDESDFDYITPNSIKENEEAEDLFKDAMSYGNEVYRKLINQYDIPKESARYVLPTIKTNIIASYNARSLYHLFKLRCCRRAQKEIREIADSMLKQVREVAPVLFSNAGPDCVRKGRCTEGDMSCGQPRDDLMVD